MEPLCHSNIQPCPECIWSVSLTQSQRLNGSCQWQVSFNKPGDPPVCSLEHLHHFTEGSCLNRHNPFFMPIQRKLMTTLLQIFFTGSLVFLKACREAPQEEQGSNSFQFKLSVFANYQKYNSQTTSFTLPADVSHLCLLWLSSVSPQQWVQNH